MVNVTPNPFIAASVVGKSTFLGAIRTKLLVVSLAFAIALIAISIAVASISFGEKTRLIIDVGLAVSNQMNSPIIELLEIIRGVVKVFSPN